MKQISHLLLFSIFLASCASAVTMVPPDVNVAPSPTPKNTATPRPTSTQEPTATPVDPNAPTDYTGKDKAGNYTKPWLDADGTPVVDENGKQLILTWVSIPVGPEGEMFNSWTEPHIKTPTLGKGFPLIEQKPWGYEKALEIDFSVEYGLESVPFLEHKSSDELSDFAKNAIQVVMEATYKKSSANISSGMGENSEVNNFRINFPNSVKIDLQDAQGNPHTVTGDWRFHIIWVKDVPDPDWTIPNRSGPATSILSMALYDDATHTVTILVANTKPMDQLSDQDFMDTILRPLGYALLLPYQSQDALNADTTYHPSPTSFANMALKGDPSYFIPSDSP